MKKSTVSFSDNDMLDGAKAYAKEQGYSFSEYVTRLIGADLKCRYGYRIVAYYDNGTTDVEKDFYTHRDLMESVRAYAELYKKGEPLSYDNSKIIGYEVYAEGKQIQKVGRTAQEHQLFDA